MNSFDANPSEVLSHHVLSAGCIWSATDWSCAYDCVIMSIFYAFLFFDNANKQKWTNNSRLTNLLTPSFQQLMASEENMMSSFLFNNVRDQLRDYLSHCDPIQFQRRGMVGASIEPIFGFLSTTESTQLCITCSPSPLINEYLPCLFFTSLWTTWSQECSKTETNSEATTQEWLDLAILAKQMKFHASSPSSHNPSSANVCKNCRIYIKDPPPLLTFETAPDTVPNHLPCPSIILSTTTDTIEYKLRSIIYYGQYHFSARLFDNSQNIWAYDGQKNNGAPLPDNTCHMSSHLNLTQMTTLQGRNAHFYVYSL